MTRPSSIFFDADQRCFLLQLRTTFYALRILGDGRLVHVGSGPAAGNGALNGLEAYEEPNYVWDYQGVRYELPAFGDVSYHDVALKVSFPEPSSPLAAGEAAHLPVRDLRLRYTGHEIRSDAVPGLVPARRAEGANSRETLCIRMKDAGYEFFATLFYRTTPEYDVIESWVELENRTSFPVAVETLSFGTMHLPAGAYEVMHAAGGWAREFVPVRRPLDQGRIVLDQRGLNTGHAQNPSFLISERNRATEDAGLVYFGALAYSGNWALHFNVLSTEAVHVFGGYEREDFELNLAPGETHRTPAFIHGCTDEGFGGASRRLHRFAREFVLPASAATEERALRPVLYNSWEATYFELSLEHQIGLARRAAEIGVELFVVDDGWFGGRRHDKAGLGDWTVSEAVFPGGLTPLIDEVKRLGMKFGLWVEPEMVNPDSDLYRAHPEWALHFPGRPRTEIRHQLILDFGNPEVVEHIYTALDRLLHEFAIDFFKWDMNRYATEPGSAAGKAVWRKHVEGVYSIMDRLRATHPRLDIQSCSGGGGRIDLGILARTDQAWTSDNTDAFDRVLIQDGYSLIYPARAMECWVTHEKNHQTGRLASLDLRFDVAMRGALGIGTDISGLSEEELAVYRRKIAFYKRIRPVVQEGDLYRLGRDPYVSVWQTVLPDASRSVYSIAVIQHLQGQYRGPFRLRALTPEAIYALSDEHGQELCRYSGWQLMHLGIPGDTAFGGAHCAIRSRTVLLERV